MFYLELQKDASYHVILPDDSRIKLPKGVQDTPNLRVELAKLAHRIVARDYIRLSEEYFEWRHMPDNVESKQLDNLIQMYALELNPRSEIWKILPYYDTETLAKIAHLERDVLDEYEELLRIQKERNEKKEQSYQSKNKEINEQTALARKAL